MPEPEAGARAEPEAEAPAPAGSVMDEDMQELLTEQEAAATAVAAGLVGGVVELAPDAAEKDSDDEEDGGGIESVDVGSDGTPGGAAAEDAQEEVAVADSALSPADKAQCEALVAGGPRALALSEAERIHAASDCRAACQRAFSGRRGTAEQMTNPTMAAVCAALGLSEAEAAFFTDEALVDEVPVVWVAGSATGKPPPAHLQPGSKRFGCVPGQICCSTPSCCPTAVISPLPSPLSPSLSLRLSDGRGVRPSVDAQFCAPLAQACLRAGRRADRRRPIRRATAGLPPPAGRGL